MDGQDSCRLFSYLPQDKAEQNYYDERPNLHVASWIVAWFEKLRNLKKISEIRGSKANSRPTTHKNISIIALENW